MNQNQQDGLDESLGIIIEEGVVFMTMFLPESWSENAIKYLKVFNKRKKRKIKKQGKRKTRKTRKKTQDWINIVNVVLVCMTNIALWGCIGWDGQDNIGFGQGYV